MSAQSVASRQVEITNAQGLHLRPAHEFVKLALTFRSEIEVRHRERICNGKSILDLASMAAHRGTQLIIEARGPDAEAAVDALSDLVGRFHELEVPVPSAEGSTS